LELATIIEKNRHESLLQKYLTFTVCKPKDMTTIALKKLLINRIAEINDVSFLNALKTILDTKTQTLSLTLQQRKEIIESQKEIESGLFVEQAELDKEFNKWLSVK